MRIRVDADACPRAVKEILYRAAKRRGIVMTLVADRPLRVPSLPSIETVLVPAGVDAADDEIVRLAEPGDLVITADVPLAAAVIKKGAVVITPHGRFYDKNNIGEQLSLRNFMDELRGTGVDTGGPPPFSAADKASFANALSALLDRQP